MSKKLRRGSVVIAHDGERFIAVKSIKRDGWEFPGGKLEKGETSAEAGAREFEEECHGVVNPADLRHVCDDVQGDFLVSLFIVKVPRNAFKISAGDGTSAAEWLSWKEVHAEVVDSDSPRYTRVFRRFIQRYGTMIEEMILTGA